MEGISILKITMISTGKEIPANIELSETYFVRRRVMMNTPKTKSVGNGCMAITIPKMVATPLPPLKPTYRGKMWPNTAAPPNINWPLIY